MKSVSFRHAQEVSQTEFFKRFDAGDLLEGSSYRLAPEARFLNLNPVYSEEIRKHFAGNPGQDASSIVWHQHANHALSSQVCCVNFLAPLMRQPEVLSKVLGDALGIKPPVMQPVGTDDQGRPVFVDFEWTGESDYLGEWPKGKRASRGANATSADAVVRYSDSHGICTVLVEWKYTETYGSPIPDNSDPERGNQTRIRRYADKFLAPEGPIKNDLGLSIEDFFWEPFYQLVRQQMLAWRMQDSGESGVDRVIVLHISPRGNKALHKVTAPSMRAYGNDVFEVFSELLVKPDDFCSTTIEAAFLPTLTSVEADGPAADWASYLLERYTFMQE
tara:strand:- start:33778 stop:34773 length:996 start_codon:yes stop_codon:yes gene_type:complete